MPILAKRYSFELNASKTCLSAVFIHKNNKLLMMYNLNSWFWNTIRFKIKQYLHENPYKLMQTSKFAKVGIVTSLKSET